MSIRRLQPREAVSFTNLIAQTEVYAAPVDHMRVAGFLLQPRTDAADYSVFPPPTVGMSEEGVPIFFDRYR